MLTTQTNGAHSDGANAHNKQIKKHTANAHNTTKYILFAARFFFGCVVNIFSVCVVKLTKVFS